jgi:hypothetical protein
MAWPFHFTHTLDDVQADLLVDLIVSSSYLSAFHVEFLLLVDNCTNGDIKV